MPTHKFCFVMPYWAGKNIKKKHTVRAGQNSPPLAVLVLEYQRNSGSQN